MRKAGFPAAAYVGWLESTAHASLECLSPYVMLAFGCQDAAVRTNFAAAA
jgi:hypothetical protein